MSRSRAVLLVALLMMIPAIAGCVGSQSQSGSSGPATSDGSGADGSDDTSDAGSSDDGSSDAGSSDGSDGSGDADDGSTGYRTPDAAMPNQEPAATGDGWARWEIQDTTRFATAYYIVRAGNCGGEAPTALDPSGHACTYEYNLTLQGDETRVEALLTWDSDKTDLNLQLVDARDDLLAASSHGMEASPDALPLLMAPNGTQWEHIAAEDPEKLKKGEYRFRVQEVNNWDPQAVAGETPAEEPMQYNLIVWVHTAPVDGTCATWEPDPCGPI